MQQPKKLPFLLMSKGCMSLRGKFGFGNLEPLQFQGRCVLAQEMGEPKTQQPSRWKCTSECKLPTADEKQRIVDLKSMFETVRTLRQRLDAVDSGCQNGHYTCKATG